MTAPTSSKWRQRFKVHPAAEKLPRMSDAELRALSKDIGENGLSTPIDYREILLPEADGTWHAGGNRVHEILDGRHRMDALEMAGIVLQPKDFRELELDDAGAVRHVVSMNVRRRHLTREQIQDVIGELLKADPAQSDRQIAKIAKVDSKTVGKQRAKMEATAELSAVEKRIGADGKTRKAKPKRAAKELAKAEGRKPSQRGIARRQAKSKERFERTLFFIREHCTNNEEMILPQLNESERAEALASLGESMGALRELQAEIDTAKTGEEILREARVDRTMRKQDREQLEKNDHQVKELTVAAKAYQDALVIAAKSVTKFAPEAVAFMMQKFADIAATQAALFPDQPEPNGKPAMVTMVTIGAGIDAARGHFIAELIGLTPPARAKQIQAVIAAEKAYVEQTAFRAASYEIPPADPAAKQPRLNCPNCHGAGSVTGKKTDTVVDCKKRGGTGIAPAPKSKSKAKAKVVVQ